MSNTVDTSEDYVIVFEAPKIVPPEFRLYYDEKGHVITYTCEKLPGDNYITIDKQTFAEARYDVRVIDGKVTKAGSVSAVCKLMPSDTGTTCANEDISIIVDKDYTGKTTNWKLNLYEL